MWMSRSRLEKDLARWRAEGWVTEEGAGRILDELRSGGARLSLSGVLAVLVAVLIGFGAMSFVAANWQEMSKLARLVLLAGSLAAAYGLAGRLFDRGLDGFAHAALLLGVALFGASIMLVAQMYHIDGHPPDAVLTWAAGALGTGALLGSSPALGAALALVGLWSGWETALSGDVHGWFLPAWAAVAAAIASRGWSGGLTLSGIALGIWIVALGYLLEDGHAHALVVMIGMALVAAGLGLARNGILPPALEVGLSVLGLAVAFAGMMALQLVESPSLGRLVILAALTLAGLVAAIAWGLGGGHRTILWLGYAGFSIEILALYFKTVGSLMGSSLFFLTTGLIVVALAGVAWRLYERQQDAKGSLP